MFNSGVTFGALNASANRLGSTPFGANHVDIGAVYCGTAQTDEVREELMAEMELTEEDILEVPVMYEPHYYGGTDYGAALSPGMQNLIVAGSTLFIPDPEGPEVNGKDVWQEAASTALAPTGLQIEYVDVFNSYHLLGGEAHCGSNVQRTPFEAEWWTQ